MEDLEIGEASELCRLLLSGVPARKACKQLFLIDTVYRVVKGMETHQFFKYYLEKTKIKNEKWRIMIRNNTKKASKELDLPVYFLKKVDKYCHENVSKFRKNGITLDQKKKIIGGWMFGESAREIAKKNNVSRETVSRVISPRIREQKRGNEPRKSSDYRQDIRLRAEIIEDDLKNGVLIPKIVLNERKEAKQIR